MNKKFLFISLFLFFISVNGYGYYEFDKRLEQAYKSIFSLHFSQAKILLEQERLEKPGNDLSLLYFNYIDFLKAFISEDKFEFDNLKKNTAIRLQELKNSTENINSPFHLYIKSEILIQQALVRLKFNETIVSAGEIRKAYKLIHENKKLFPAFILNDKITGVLNTIIGTVPAKYQWIIKYAGMEGNINEGLNELQSLLKKIETTSYEAYRPEILFYLGNMYTVLSVPIDTSFLIRQIYPYTVNSPLLSFIHSNILSKNGKNDEALNTLNVSIQNNLSYPFIYLYYKRGMARLRKMDLSSEQDFEYFIKHTKGLNNIKSAYQKLAWIELIKGDTSKYNHYVKLCIENGVKINEDDRIANDEATNGLMANKYLLKSRLYFDGGYYELALSELAGNKIENFPCYRDQLEITYRLGRIMQMTQQFEKAISYYEMTIQNGQSSDFYFAANSALMLGLIYEEKNQLEFAKTFFQKALLIKHKEYKNSIDQKALAGLERLKNKK